MGDQLTCVQDGTFMGTGLPFYNCPAMAAYNIKIMVAPLPAGTTCEGDGVVWDDGFVILYGLKGIGDRHFFVYDPKVSTDLPPAPDPKASRGGRSTAFSIAAFFWAFCGLSLSVL